MAEAPPALPSNLVSDWAKQYGEMIGGMIGGPAVGAAAASGAAGAAIGQQAAEESKAAGGGPLSADFWHRILLDVEVYGFLFLLVGIALYGLFAPQVNVAVQKAAKAAL